MFPPKYFDMLRRFRRVRTFLKKNLNASRRSEHPSVRGKKMTKRLGGHRLQKQNLFLERRTYVLLYCRQAGTTIRPFLCTVTEHKN